MKINIRADSVVIEGYVNAVERASKPLFSRFGEFIEKICAGAFGRALQRNDNVRILLNHDITRDLGGTATGELELEEDNIGLHARAVITDKKVVDDARHGNLVGWSFGFQDRDVTVMQDNETGLPFRMVKDLDLFEVSLLNREKTPAYNGTLVNVRDDGKEVKLGETNEPDNIEVIDETEPVTSDGVDETTKEAIEELRADEITGGNLPAEAVEDTAINTDTKSYDNSKYINIVAELKTWQNKI